MQLQRDVHEQYVPEIGCSVGACISAPKKRWATYEMRPSLHGACCNILLCKRKSIDKHHGLVRWYKWSAVLSSEEHALQTTPYHCREYLQIFKVNSRTYHFYLISKMHHNDWVGLTNPATNPAGYTPPQQQP